MRTRILMARFARVVIPECPHHITQRGNRRQEVFYSDGDRRMYLKILRDHCHRWHMRVLAWCLMTNHVHLVVIPAREDSLAKALGRTHNDYARWLHVQQRQVGHLWQNRFHSCPLEGRHVWDAIRYVELNPVRAGLVRAAADWPWSSAAAHLAGRDDWLTAMDWWSENWSGSGEWRIALEAGMREAGFAARLREATRTGRPCGTEEFTTTLEGKTGRLLRPAKRGRKPVARSMAAEANFGIS